MSKEKIPAENGMKASLRLREPSSFRNRSGMNFSGSFQYFSSMCAEYRFAMIIASLGMSKPWSLVSFFATCGKENVTENGTIQQNGKRTYRPILVEIMATKGYSKHF